MIETDLKRIADAQEKIVELLEKIANPLMTLPPQAPRPAPVPPAAPKAGLAAFTPPAAPVTPAEKPVNAPSSPEELRLLAQKIAQKCGPKTLEFTQWVNELLVPYGVKTLLLVPADKLGEVAVKLVGWAQKEGING